MTPPIVLFEERRSGGGPFARALARVGARVEVLDEPAQVLGAVVSRRPGAIVWPMRPVAGDLRVLRALRNAAPDVPLLLLSAEGVSGMEAVREIGGFDWVLLPADPDRLDEVLSNALRHAFERAPGAGDGEGGAS